MSEKSNSNDLGYYRDIQSHYIYEKEDSDEAWIKSDVCFKQVVEDGFSRIEEVG